MLNDHSYLYAFLHSADYLLEFIVALVLLFTWRKRSDRSRLFLGCFFLLSIVGSVVLVLENLFGYHPDTVSLLSPLSWVMGFPVFFLLLAYIVECMYPYYLTLRRAAIAIAPTLVMGVLTALVYQLHPTSLSSLGELVQNLSEPDVLLRLLLFLLFPVYGILLEVLLVRSKNGKASRPFFSWLCALVLVMTFTYLGGQGLHIWWLDVMHVAFYLTITILSLFMEFYDRLSVVNAPSPLAPSPLASSPLASSPVDEPASLDPLPFMNRPLPERIDLLIHEQCIWQDADLTLEEMAQRAGTNRTYLLQCIKQMGYKNFSEMINRHRVEHALKQQQLHPDMPLLDILYASGYRSRTSALRNYHAYAAQ